LLILPTNLEIILRNPQKAKSAGRLKLKVPQFLADQSGLNKATFHISTDTLAKFVQLVF
jgi:hypothetical protein